MADPIPGVTFEGIEKTFGTFQAVKPLSLEIRQGELFSLLGPSGCGKTTTLRMIAGFEQPSAGRIRIGADDVTGDPAHRRNFGMVFQNLALFPHLTVNQNVAFGLEMRRVAKTERKKRVSHALDLVSLGHLGDRYPAELSGGQQQRVALARAIIFEPEVLLLDEPLSALDKMLRDQMQIEIRELQQRLGITTVFVTHDQEEALTMSDRVAVMQDGKLLQVGSPRDIYDRPQTEFVATFLGAANLLEGKVLGVQGRDVEVQIGDQHTRATLPEGQNLKAGDKVKLSLRPERIRLDEGGPLQATVRSVVFQGATCRIDLTFMGQDITAILPSEAVRGLAPGDETSLNWSDDSIVALER
ncbi:spermidine/putrescine import ATP-binding protein PotA [Roseovarius sp. A-2]|uniref:ABC transporter ATP-binding protein n=1 Tax=Roseovarius sp. A-2 TaxID=1570360 RepID=UPI0009B50CE1|nr:ABC transporter ATP-binding protein [Roseovarius sp. A-2]GAW37310.1 spermidine/putrescine import ATP-binding protein PotA [Roseovarius sp. A-2]